MKQPKMQILFFVIMILQIKISEERCISCDSCNENTGECNICLNGYKSSNPFPSNCYKCDGIGDYYIFNYSATPPDCHFIASCNDSTSGLSDTKTVYDTNECVEECPQGTFLFNNICYKGSCPPDTELVTENITTASECKCSYRYIYDSSISKYVWCGSENSLCPDGYAYNGTSLECILNMTITSMTEKPLVRVIKAMGITNYQILTECNQDEYQYSDSTKDYIECIKDCKFTSRPYHYLNDSRCVQNCDGGDYAYEKEKICYKSAEDCPTNYNILSSSPTAPHKCFDYEYCVDTAYPFFYETTKTCLKNCVNQISLNTEVPTEPMYELIEVSNKDSSVLIKKCVTQCPPEKPFLDNYDTNKYRCVTKCGLDGFRVYTFNNSCHDNCSYISGYEYLTVDTRECVPVCPDGYFTSENSTDKNCYTSCNFLPTYNYQYNNTCVKNDSCPFLVENDGKNLCYDSCPTTAPYHNLGSTRCFASEYGCNDPKNNPAFIYREFNDSFICESSCLDSGSFITEDFFCLPEGNCTNAYPYEYEGMCYKNKCPNENLRYEDHDGIKKCHYPNNCTEEEFIQKGECVQKCNIIDYPFSIAPESGMSGLCLSTIEECYRTNHIYVNDKKQCMSNCSNGFALQNEPGTFHPYERDAGNCLSECPPDFPYEANKICYKEGCPSGYFAQNNTESGMFICESFCTNTSYFVFQKKLCVPDCRDTSDPFHVNADNSGVDLNMCYNKCPDDKPFYYSPDFECLENCGGFYYDPDTKECFKNCTDTPDNIKIFAFETSGPNDNPCLSSCPDGYHYQANASSLFCIAECPDGSYQTTKDRKVCAPFCGINEKVGYNNVCVKECPDFYYFSRGTDDEDSLLWTTCTDNCYFQGKNENGSDVQYLFVVNSTNQCVDKCPTTESYIYEYKCYKKCPEAKPFYYESSDENSTCYAVCPDSSPYYIENYKECLQNCSFPNNYLLENKYICLNQCPNDYPVEDMSDEINNITICRKTCPPGLINEDNKCVTGCNTTGTGYKPFYDPIMNSCVSKCPDRMPFYNQTSLGYFQCKTACEINEMVLPTKECTAECTENFNFIGKGNVCKTECNPNVDGKYYHNTSFSSIYQCIESCSNAPDSKTVSVEGDLQCIDECPSNHPYKSPLNICYSICNVNSDYSFSMIDTNGNHICALSCSGETPFYLEDKICINETTCISMGRVTNEYNQCILNCDPNSRYKYNLDGTCSLSCNSTYSKYSLRDFVCVEKCEEPLNYVRNNKICESSCDSESLYPYAYKEPGETEYKCVEKCPDGSYYFEGGNNCSTCDYYVIQNTQQCIHSCKDLTGYYFFDYDSSDTDSTYQNNTCVKSCASTSKPFTLENDTCTDIPCMNSSVTHFFYRERDKICLTKCPDGYIYDENYTCIINCKMDQFLLPIGKCADECDQKTQYVYYIPGENECLKTCPQNYYKNGFECLKKCNDTKPFSYNGECVENCPNEKKYYISNFTHGETDLQQICMTDCTPEYPFLIIDNSVSPPLYQCVGSCPSFYFAERDPNIFARQCKEDCNGSSPFIGENNQCLTQCPSDKPFYIPSTENPPKNQICLEKCNDTFPYHEKNNTNECINECSTEYIHYENGECVKACDKNQFWVSDNDPIGNTKTFCLDECNTVYGLFSTPENECVPNCSLGNFTADYARRKCECINLYKINEETGVKECYQPELLNCLNNTDGFIYLQENTKRCLKTCPTTINSLGICMNSTECPPNSRLDFTEDGEKKCVCKYKFYRDGLNKLVCLGENEDCLHEHQYFVLETKECVRYCPANYSKIVHNYCLDECPENSQEDSTNTNLCKCKKYWYIDEKKVGDENRNEFICMKESNLCPEKYPLVNANTNECVARCSGMNYIFYNDQCLQSCENTANPTTMVQITKNDPVSKFANFTCRCNNLWYYEIDNKNVICSNGAQSKCRVLTENKLRYMVKDTKRCVSTCPEDYPYAFNSFCFSDCEKNGLIYGYKITNDESKTDRKECKCQYPWKLNSENEKDCETQPYCSSKTSSDYSSDYLLINSTNECIENKVCPPSHSYLFNGICYDSPDQCPNNTHTDFKFVGQCVCDNLWFEVSVSYKGSIKDKYCIDKSVQECPYEFPYLINNTRQCLKENCSAIDSKYYEFNRICYEGSCPTNTTKQASNSKLCVCDKLKGFWYEQQTLTKSNYICGLEACPKEKPMFINKEKECLHSCDDRRPSPGNYYYKLDNICYLKEDCPEHSVANDTYHECIYRHLDNAENLTELHTFIQEDILRLYERNVTPGGLLYNSYNISLQIYPLNKNGSLGSRDIALQSNLSFINLENCIKQIYAGNDMLDSDNIIVVKYDILNITDKYMMNPVEYEFYSSRTGKKIDATVCQSHSVVISYPISYESNKYNDFSEGNYKNNFKTKFERGKLLKKQDSEIDTFDNNNSLYYDLCISCEIEGKDLVLKDRIKHLYPNVSLCEANCTYNKTNFEEERVYCNCPLKEELDFQRDYKISNYNFSIDEIDSLQKGPSNVASMTCVSRLSNTETISQNGGFYYSFFVLVSEITLCSLAATIGFQTVSKIISSSFGPSSNNPDNAFEEIKIQDPSSLPKSNPPPKEDNVEEVINNNINLSENERLNNKKAGDGAIHTEFIPEEYVFIFFDMVDKGVIRQVPRGHIPFSIGQTTNRLIQKIPNYNYSKDLNEPYPKDQNIIEITDDEIKDDFNKEFLYAKENVNEVLNIRDRDKRGKSNYNVSEKVSNKNRTGEVINIKKPHKKKRGISNKKGDDDEDQQTDDYIKPTKDQEMFIADEILYRSIRKQARLLRAPFPIASKYETQNILVLILAEICDKIYFFRTVFLTKKYEIFFVKLSLYILYHILLLTILAFFFDIKTIQKIFNEEDFPDLSFYLLYGFLSNLVVWFIYRMLKCLISNFKQINKLIRLQNDFERTNNEELIPIINKKKKSFISDAQVKLIIYFCIQFVLVVFCFCYLVMFCGIYTGTKKKVFKAYGITILEIIVIKLIYALILCILRKVSIDAKVKGLYEFYRFLENYFS